MHERGQRGRGHGVPRGQDPPHAHRRGRRGGRRRARGAPRAWSPWSPSSAPTPGPADGPPRSSRLGRRFAPWRRSASVPSSSSSRSCVIVIHEAGTSSREGVRDQGDGVLRRLRPQAVVADARARPSTASRRSPLGGYVKIAGMNPYEHGRARGPAQDLRSQADLAARAGDPRGPGDAFRARVPVLRGVARVRRAARGQRRRRSPGSSRTLHGVESPAAAAGLRAGDVVVAVDGLHDPSSEQLVSFTTAHAGEPVTFTIERDGRSFQAVMVPVVSQVNGQQIGRIGVGVRPRRIVRNSEGPVGSVAGAVGLVGEQAVLTVQGVGRSSGLRGSVASSTWSSPTRPASRPIPRASSG